MANAYLRGASTQGVGVTFTTVSLSSVATGNLLAAGADGYSIAGTTHVYSFDVGAGTWTRHEATTASAGNHPGTSAASCPNVQPSAGSVTVRVTQTGTGDISLAVAEFSGPDPTAPYDASGVAFTDVAGATYSATTGAATTQDSDLLVGIFAHSDTTATPTSADVTLPAALIQTDALKMPLALGYNLDAGVGGATGTASCSWASDQWSAIVLALKQPPPGTPDPAEPFVVASPYRR